MVNDRHGRRPAGVEEEEWPAAEDGGREDGADKSWEAAATGGRERIDGVHGGRFHFDRETRTKRRSGNEKHTRTEGGNKENARVMRYRY